MLVSRQEVVMMMHQSIKAKLTGQHPDITPKVVISLLENRKYRDLQHPRLIQ
jgi:hypothetical protein